MKVTREYYRHGGALTVIGFVKVNPLERWSVRRMMRAGRHNLRPSYNWPGLRRHGATFILAPKDAPNKDLGPKPGAAAWLVRTTDGRYNEVEIWSISAAATLLGMNHLIVGTAVAATGIVASIYLRKRKVKHEQITKL